MLLIMGYLVFLKVTIIRNKSVNLKVFCKLDPFHLKPTTWV